MKMIIAVLLTICSWIAPPAVCGQISPLPNPRLTPGALNKAITQDTIKDTICNPKWSTKSIRPSTSYTNKIKRMTMNQYERPGTMADYELDHLISLELGGDPTDPRNLWPEKWNLIVDGEDLGAHTKDKVENFLHKAVCDGAVPLATAQEWIAKDWTMVWRAMRLEIPMPPPKPRPNVVPSKLIEAR